MQSSMAFPRGLLVLLSSVIFFNFVSYQTFSRLNSLSFILVSNSTCAIPSSSCWLIFFSIAVSSLKRLTNACALANPLFKVVFSLHKLKAFYLLTSPCFIWSKMNICLIRWIFFCFESCSSSISDIKLSSPFYFNSNHSWPTSLENSLILMTPVLNFFRVSLLKVYANIFFLAGSFSPGICHSYSDSAGSSSV